MKLNIKQIRRIPELEDELALPPGTIRSMTIYGSDEGDHSSGDIELDVTDTLTEGDQSRIKAALGDFIEIDKRLSKSIGGHVR